MSKNLSDEVTPEHIYQKRRAFLKNSIYGASALATALTYRWFRGSPSDHSESVANYEASKDVTSYEGITGYNNFYEFSTDKLAVARESANWRYPHWALSVEGLVDKPLQISLAELAKFKTEERIYRFRCVEGWSMVIPWTGFTLASLVEMAVPKSEAKFVAFETYFNDVEMPNADSAGLPFPYLEGLTLAEAMNPLTFMATGIYKKNLLNQNGAPLRLVVPWKYGFKSIKSVVKIKLTSEQPTCTWNEVAPQEYGFYSNVNPEVDHPRWSQKKERRIGELGMRPTLLFNGYEKEVAYLYDGLDLKKNF